jgi:hypothetical protein
MAKKSQAPTAPPPAVAGSDPPVPYIHGNSRYKPEYADAVAKYAGAFGATHSQIADMFKTSRMAVERWIEKFPEFADAVKRAKAESVARVEKTLYQKATGYEKEVEEIVKRRDGTVETVKTLKHVAPDTTSIIFFLKNRERDDWRDVYRPDYTNEDFRGSQLPIINITLNAADGQSAPLPAVDMTDSRGGSVEHHRRKQLARHTERQKEHPPAIVTVNRSNKDE